MINMPPAPDAGASILGHYGLANPMVRWYLTRDPEFLAYTPAELAEFSSRYTRPPLCRHEVTWRDGNTGICGAPMKWRYDQHDRPVWKCYMHEPAAMRQCRKVTPAMLEQPDFKAHLDDLIRRTLQGENLDIVYAPESGGWVLVD